jgi:hypothetical protein
VCGVPRRTCTPSPGPAVTATWSAPTRRIRWPRRTRSLCCCRTPPPAGGTGLIPLARVHPGGPARGGPGRRDGHRPGGGPRCGGRHRDRGRPRRAGAGRADRRHLRDGAARRGIRARSDLDDGAVVRHLIAVAELYREFLRGDTGGFATVAERQASNDRGIATVGECTGEDLARSVRALAAEAEAAPAGLRIPWHGGLRLPVSAVLGIYLGELLVHGHDLAVAVGRPWRIPRRRPGWRTGRGPTATSCGRSRGQRLGRGSEDLRSSWSRRPAGPSEACPRFQRREVLWWNTRPPWWTGSWGGAEHQER